MSHEHPLVVFSASSTAGAGLLFAGAALTAGPDDPSGWRAVALGTLLLSVGVLVSLGHLGRPLRAPLAILGLGRSPLSLEVVLASAAIILGGFLTLAPDHSLAPAASLAAAAAALAFLVTLGLVYRLRGQAGWEGTTPAVPLLLGLALGAASATASGSSAVRLMVVCLSADSLILLDRWRRLARPDGVEPVHPAAYGRRHSILLVRLAVVDVLPMLLLAFDRMLPALACLGAGLLLDRWAFYALAACRTTEAGLARIDRFIQALPPAAARGKVAR